MHLAHVRLENLGPVKLAELILSHRFNAVVGINGSGKSTLLNAIALMLGRYSSVVRTGRVGGTTFGREQIKRGAPFAQITVSVVTQSVPTIPIVEWSMGISRPGRKEQGTLTNSKQLIAFGTVLAQQIEAEPYQANLPLVVYYSAQRAILDIPLRVRGSIPFEQYGALEGSLAQSGRSFREFFSWFREREDLENERRLEGDLERDPELTAVRRAIAGMLPNFENLRVKRSPLRMLITKNGLDLRVDELSDGEKTTLAMAGDLARRLATANPGMSNALDGSAIVLIDELELHLHPDWQRKVVVRLRDTFPCCQFIVSTHSPQVLSEIPANGIFLLRDGAVERTDQSRGRSSNLILKELMGATARPAWADDELNSLYDAIDDEKWKTAQSLFDKLSTDLGSDDPDLAAARAILVNHSARR